MACWRLSLRLLAVRQSCVGVDQASCDATMSMPEAVHALSRELDVSRLSLTAERERSGGNRRDATKESRLAPATLR
jgi:hypothetical protein